MSESKIVENSNLNFLWGIPSPTSLDLLNIKINSSKKKKKSFGNMIEFQVVVSLVAFLRLELLYEEKKWRNQMQEDLIFKIRCFPDSLSLQTFVNSPFLSLLDIDV